MKPSPRAPRFARQLLIGTLLGFVLSLPAAAQELLLHFPLDGSPAVQGSAAGDSRLYVLDTGPAPATVPGKFGNALYFSGNAAIAMPFALDHAVYPQVTVTAWVKVDAQSTGERTVFSAGNGNVPKLSVYGDRANFVSARGSQMFDAAMPRDEWVFVAGVIDVAGARIATHQGDAHRVKEGVNVGNLYGPSGYRNPEDPSVPFGPYVFIGSHGFGQWRANKMAIDDVRVYASALTPEQVAAVRDAGAAPQAVAATGDTGTCQGNADCATGTYCAADGACYPDSQLPLGYTPPSDGSGLAGRWEYVAVSEGSFMSPGGGVAIWLEFTGPDSNLSGTVQSAALIFGGTVDGFEPMSNVVRSGDMVTFSSPSLPSFNGEISSDGSKITTRSLDPSREVVFERVDATAATAQPTGATSTTTTSSTPSSGGTPSFYKGDGVEVALEDRPAGPLDITYASEEEALAAQAQREREAAEAELLPQQSELEEDAAAQLPYYPVGTPAFSAVAGQMGKRSSMYDMETLFINSIVVEQVDPENGGVTTSKIQLSGWDGEKTVTAEAFYAETYHGSRPSGRWLPPFQVSLDRQAAVGSIQTCSERAGEGISRNSIHGLSITGSRINPDGSTYYGFDRDRNFSGLSNCAGDETVWSGQMLCPTNPEHLATGLVVHLHEWKEEIVGLQLICRKVGVR